MKDYSIKNELKGYIAFAGKSMRWVGTKLDSLKGTDLSNPQSSFIRKVANETISYKEVKMVADILGYEIVWKKIEK